MKSKKPKISLYITTAILFLSLAAGIVPVVKAQENLQIFGAEQAENIEQKGRDLLACASGLLNFFTPPNIDFLEDFLDYIRDFEYAVIYPAYYADISNVERQLNESRYHVISAFSDCDTNRLNSVTRAYYKLEAELYFLRHYVDVSEGYVRVRVPGEFEGQMMESFTGRADEDKYKNDALFSAYFDEFAGRYKDRAKAYANFGDDPVYSDLAGKFQELLDTLMSLRDLGTAMANLTEEAVAQPGKAIGLSVVALYETPVKALQDTWIAIDNRFKVCIPDAGGECITRENAGKEISDLLGIGKSSKVSGDRKTYADVQVAIQKQELTQTEDLDKGEMLARYEFLYGRINGDGVSALAAKMDKFIAILGKGSGETVPGSLEPLAEIQKLVQNVLDKECK